MERLHAQICIAKLGGLGLRDVGVPRLVGALSIVMVHSPTAAHVGVVGCTPGRGQPFFVQMWKDGVLSFMSEPLLTPASVLRALDALPSHPKCSPCPSSASSTPRAPGSCPPPFRRSRSF